VGPGRESVPGGLKGGMKVVRANGMGERRGSYLYRLMRDGNASPRLCGVSSQLVRDGRSARDRRFRFLCGLRGLFLVGTGLIRLASSPSGAGADGRSASPIRFRLPINHGIVTGAELG
jgi:hypothetical protein